jgi:hypothetical protein
VKIKTALIYLLAHSLTLSLICLGPQSAEAQRKKRRPWGEPVYQELTFPDDELLFGPEFTFWTNGQGNIIARDYVSSKMYHHLILNQPKPAKFKALSNFNFLSPEGWEFKVSTDPGVIEVTTKPMTVQHFEKFATNMQDAIFVTHYNAGYFPALYGGGGHLNIGLDYFKNKNLLLRNFIVDYMNHPELSMGIMNYDTCNAISFALLPDLAIKNFLTALDSELLGRPHFNVRSLSFALMGALKSPPDPFTVYWNKIDRHIGLVREKSFAINFSNLLSSLIDAPKITKESRLEIRAVRAQASMDVWVRQIRLIRNRIKYLETLDRPIAYNPRVLIDKPLLYVTKDQVENPMIEPELAMRAFYDYVTESGEKWQDHRDYMWPQWVWNGERDKFESSIWFKNREAERGCSQLLAS